MIQYDQRLNVLLIIILILGMKGATLEYTNGHVVLKGRLHDQTLTGNLNVKLRFTNFLVNI